MLQLKQYAPVYLLDGEEPYYLDKLLHYFENDVLQPHEKDFNLNVLFSKDVEMKDVVNACRRYPMFADRQVVILREATQVKVTKLAELEDYLENPTPSTIFVIEHRFKKIDGRTKLIKLIKERGIYFTSTKLKDDREVMAWIQNYGREIHFEIPENEAALLSMFLGNDLQKICNEIDKIRINVPNEKKVTEKMIQDFVGISREYNPMEFSDALMKGNKDRIYKMLAYFFANPKSAPLPLIAGMLYSNLSRVYQAHFLRGMNDKDMAAAMGISPYFVKNVLAQLPSWPLHRVEKTLLLLAKYNTMAVGVNSMSSDTELLKEMAGQMLDLMPAS